jgi:ribosome-binding ATPase YchF (GTP1/OBG family)
MNTSNRLVNAKFFDAIFISTCITDPEEARVTVPDERFDWLCKQYNPEKKTPAFVSGRSVHE